MQVQEVKVAYWVSFIMSTEDIKKKDDLGAPIITYTIVYHDLTRSLCENGSNINMTSLSIIKQFTLSVYKEIYWGG